uniref:Uncharacterized protein n=1 Tax=Faecalibaculum rodentium TaxID=1702221 RepID=A0A140DUH4_9FIRM|nr:hypothetical protein AALO17_11670 [Faecalibaculum rodentium]
MYKQSKVILATAYLPPVVVFEGTDKLTFEREINAPVTLGFTA